MRVEVHLDQAGGSARVSVERAGSDAVWVSWPAQTVVCCDGKVVPVAVLNEDSEPPAWFNDPHGLVPVAIQCGQCGAMQSLIVDIYD